MAASLDHRTQYMDGPPVLKNDDDSDSENANVDFLAAKQSVKSPCFKEFTHTHTDTHTHTHTHTFRVRPKFHLLQHMLDKACRGCNPKDEWAYKDETFGYRIQSLWFKRTSTVHANPHTDSEKILLRWMNEESFLSMDLAASSSKG